MCPPPRNVPSTPCCTEMPLQEGQSCPAGDVQTLVGVKGSPRTEDAVDELPGEKGEVGVALVHRSPGTKKGFASVRVGRCPPDGPELEGAPEGVPGGGYHRPRLTGWL